MHKKALKEEKRSAAATSTPQPGAAQEPAPPATAPQEPEVAQPAATAPVDREWPYLLLLGFLAVLVYWQAFATASFGPEFGYFFFLNSDLSFGQLLRKYLEIGYTWYRPTAFCTPYWFFSKFISWHNIAAWKLANFSTMLAVCGLLYLFVRRLFPERRLGPVLAVFFFLSHPALFLPVFEISAFDFAHIFFILAVFLLFLGAWHSTGKRASRLNLLGVLAYAAALTSKEVTIIAPIYLSMAAIVLSWEQLRRREWQPFLIRSGNMLMPYFALMLLFVLLHLMPMPERPVDSLYRTKVNLAFIYENTTRFPLWMARVFNYYGDKGGTAQAHTKVQNDIVGCLLLLAVIAQWTGDIRRKAYRTGGILMVLWMGVFLLIPIYAGSYLWHINLALCGYAALVGVGLAGFIENFSNPTFKRFVILAVFGGFLVVGRVNMNEAITAGVHSRAFGLNTEKFLKTPPIAQSQLGRNPLIYIEDRLALGNWSYGGDHLFALAYLDPTLEQVIVPPAAEVPADLVLKWLSQPNAFFLRYDDSFQWQDASQAFRNQAISRVDSYMDRLLTENKTKEVVDVLGAHIDRLAGNYLAHYHYAVGLQGQGRRDEAMKQYGETLRLNPKYFYALYNRGMLQGQMNRRAEACADLKRANSLEPGNQQAVAAVRQWCR